MASSASSFVGFVCRTLALHTLDHCGRVRHRGNRGFVFPCSKRQAAVPRNIAGWGLRGWLLDRLVVSSRNLLPSFCKLQQDLRHTRCGNRADGLVVLDGFCLAGGSRIKCGTGKDKPRGEATTKARTSHDYEN